MMDEQRCIIARGLNDPADLHARSNDIRTAARLPMLDWKDTEAFRATLDSRYRPTRSFGIGDRVA